VLPFLHHERRGHLTPYSSYVRRIRHLIPSNRRVICPSHPTRSEIASTTAFLMTTTSREPNGGGGTLNVILSPGLSRSHRVWRSYCRGLSRVNVRPESGPHDCGVGHVVSLALVTSGGQAVRRYYARAQHKSHCDPASPVSLTLPAPKFSARPCSLWVLSEAPEQALNNLSVPQGGIHPSPGWDRPRHTFANREIPCSSAKPHHESRPRRLRREPRRRR
jgi:hypothetical protein